MLRKARTPENFQPIAVETHGATLAGIQVPALLQTARLCAHLGVNSSTIWRWTRERNFPKPLEVGSKVRMWRTIEVEAWLNSQSATAQATRQATAGACHE